MLQERAASEGGDVQRRTAGRSSSVGQRSKDEVQRNLSTLQLYTSIFGRKQPLVAVGDANAHFRRSLRKYTDFSGLRNAKWLQQRLQSHRPRLNKAEHARAAGDQPQPNRLPPQPKTRPKHEPQPDTERDDEPDEECEEEEPEPEAEPEQIQQPTEADEPGTIMIKRVGSPVRITENECEEEGVAVPHIDQIQDMVRDVENEMDMAEEEGYEDELMKSVQEMQKAASHLDSEASSVDPGSRSPPSSVRFQAGMEQKRRISPSSTKSRAEDKSPEVSCSGRDMASGASECPGRDSKVVRELEEAECQARQTANVISELKSRVTALMCKEHMSEREGQELECMNRQLMAHMSNFEEKTRLIQMLVNTADENLKPRADGAVSLEAHREEMLPKVVVCGATEDNMPKLLICDPPKKCRRGHSTDRRRRQSCERPPTCGDMCGQPPAPPGFVPRMAQRLSESYDMQEKLAADNVDLEGKRYRLQEELLCRDKTVETLQRKVCALQAEMKMVVKENMALNDKLAVATNRCRSQPDMPCGSARGICPADIENRLQHYSAATGALEKQVESMEDEVRRMQDELDQVRKERAEMERQRNLREQQLLAQQQAQQSPCKAECRGPCRSSPPMSEPLSSEPFASPVFQPSAMGAAPPLPMGVGPMGMGGGGPCLAEQHLRELREQYNRLQDDYKSKLVEVAGLRADNDSMKRTAGEAERLKRELEAKLAEAEREASTHRSERSRLAGSREQLVEQEQQLAVAKQRFREAQDELDELRACIQEQAAQLDDYRCKYLGAQQQVEEQRRQIDVMEMENARISEQVTCEIQRVKAQFQEKLAELAPLPDILKATQLKLQEEQHVRGVSERNADALQRELQMYKEKLACLASQMEKQRSDQQVGEDERVGLMSRVAGWECKCAEVQAQCDRLRTELARAEEQRAAAEKRLEERAHESAQLCAQLEGVREESARQVARTKERCESVRRSLQAQLAEAERQLAQSRAAARAAQRDRDEVRHKMQAQIANLNDNFEEAQLRIRSLQGHVNFLKTSYTTMFGAGGGPHEPPPPRSCGPPPTTEEDAPCDCAL